MIDLTMRQAFAIWMELIEAYHGTNGYGGNTAEIYAYSLQQCDPATQLTGTLGEEAQREQAALAAVNLKTLIALFLETYRCSALHIDGEPWQEALKSGLVHRCHVRILR